MEEGERKVVSSADVEPIYDMTNVDKKVINIHIKSRHSGVSSKAEGSTRKCANSFADGARQPLFNSSAKRAPRDI